MASFHFLHKHWQSHYTLYQIHSIYNYVSCVVVVIFHMSVKMYVITTLYSVRMNVTFNMISSKSHAKTTGKIGIWLCFTHRNQEIINDDNAWDCIWYCVNKDSASVFLFTMGLLLVCGIKFLQWKIIRRIWFFAHIGIG